MGTSGTLTVCNVDRLGAFFLKQIYLTTNVPFDNTVKIYLIRKLWKLGLGLGLNLTILAFFTENNENKHPIFREFHGR